ncbi:exosome complex component RRP46, partial [Agrilus planipennis]|uniref:Exosome complex component RRP46 n=1 Tax=Agrilus planipennis TaxID=224129 RepID=A0A1W4XFY8_AGRPL
PVEVKMQNILTDRTSVEVNFRPKAGLPNISDRLQEQIVKNSIETAILCELYPRSSVVITIQEMQNYGGLIACAINATCAALLNSGIDMRFLLAAVNCTVDKDNELHLDPDQIERDHAKAAFTFVFDSLDKKVVSSQTTGSFTLQQFQVALDLCKAACDCIFDFYKTITSKQISKHVV